MHNSILARAVLGMYFAHQGLADEEIRANIATAIVAYVLSRVVPRYVPLANQLRLLALFVSLGMTNNLNGALESKTLLALIKMSSKFIPRAAALLWQNGYYEDALLTQLNANEELAKQIIKLIFDGDLAGVKKALIPPEEVVVKPEPRRLTLPSVFRKPAAASRSSLSARVEPTPAVKIKDPLAREKPLERFPSLFFALPKVSKAADHDFSHRRRAAL